MSDADSATPPNVPSGGVDLAEAARAKAAKAAAGLSHSSLLGDQNATAKVQNHMFFR